MTALPGGSAFTRTDLGTLPDGGHRYELVDDGCLIVTPRAVDAPSAGGFPARGPSRRGMPGDYAGLHAPFDVTIADDTVLQPDLLVARRSDFDEHGPPGPPLLAVLSPSTRRIDLGLKRSPLRGSRLRVVLGG